MIRKFKFNFTSKTLPFPHQAEAIDYIQKKEFVALFDEQGLGKTKIVLEALCNNIRENKLDGGLIICRKNLIQTWQDEIETHSYLKSIVLRGSRKEKGIKFMGFAHFYLINYESVISEINRLKMFLTVRRLAIVLDESHAIKNPESQTTKAVLQLAILAQKKIIISGTPIANKPDDLWSQYYFLDGGKLLGKSYSKFKSQFLVNLRDKQILENNENFRELRSLIKDNSIRRLKDDVLELPEKIYFDEYVNLAGKQLEMYEHLKKDLSIEIKKLNGEIIIDESEELLKKLLRLEQIASNPKLIDQAYSEEPAKFPRLDQLVTKIINRGEKIIIWTCFVDNIRYLNKKYQKYGSQMLYGEIPIEQRNTVVKRFKTEDTFKILVANPAAAKEGLTLTSANNAIYLDRNFNLVDYLQSQDRIHRISQKKECNIIKIIARNTIDEYIDEILKRKTQIASYVQNDRESADLSDSLTKEKILTYLG